MFKDKVDAAEAVELEALDQQEPLLNPASQNVPEGMVSVRFFCHTEEKKCCGCCDCCCCKDKVYLHQHQIVLPEDTTVGQFMKIASRKVGADKTYNICGVVTSDEGSFILRDEDPVGPIIKSYRYFSTPPLGLSRVEITEKHCCLLI